MKPRDRVPLVVHVIHHFGTGGLENGLVNIINRTAPGRYRHAVVSIVGVTEFAGRITTPDVPILTLNASDGHSFTLYFKLWRALWGLRPDIVHSRNLAALEAQLPATFVPGVKRVHGEHGRDMFDLYGKNRKYNLLRRAIRPLVQRYISVSKDLAVWLEDSVGVPSTRLRQIYNGVDNTLFRPRPGSRPNLAPAGFIPDDALVIGTVGRLAGVKDQATLVRAFARLLSQQPGLRRRARLVIAGDGPERGHLEELIAQEGVGAVTWLAGERSDIPAFMQSLDVFVLPSLGEGISNTILEAMASGLPVVASRVGGNPELVTEGDNGLLVPSGDPEALADALARYAEDPGLAQRQGARGRRKVEQTFNWEHCVAGYLSVYDELLGMN